MHDGGVAEELDDVRAEGRLAAYSHNNNTFSRSTRGLMTEGKSALFFNAFFLLVVDGFKRDDE